MNRRTVGVLFLVAGLSSQTACSGDDDSGSSPATGGVSAFGGTGATGGSGTGGAGSGGVTGGNGGVGGSAGGGTAGSATGGVSGSGNGGSGGGSCAPTLFSSDWSGGLLDGGKWTSWGGTPVLAVVSASGLGFPASMANVLRVQMGTGSFDWVQADGKWSLPQIGESRAYRIYFRNDVGAVDGGWSATHPLESKGTDGAIDGDYYAIHFGSDVAPTFPFAFATAAEFPRNIYTINPTSADVGRLDKGTTYRLEWKWTRTAASEYSLDLRITGPDDTTVLYDASSIEAWGGNSLASDNSGFPLDDSALTGVRVGTNGGFSASGTQYVYWGGFAVCADWCGGC